MENNKFDFASIDKKWQERWQKSKNYVAVDFDEKPKHYHLIEFPYPSGAGLHVGHCMGYGASDAYCRMKRMQGFNVMFPMGWDAFGLPTENFAIKNKIKPQKATADNVATFKKQMDALGLSFDWDREINTTDPNYYRWTQWIFEQFYKHGINQKGELVEVADDDLITPRLAYQAEMPINWCSSCKIGLANEEVINGKCERCGAETIKKMQKQWMLRITAYADRLISDLDDVDYLDKIKTQQVNWIGKSIGTNIKFKVKSSKLKVEESLRDDYFIEVFTTRADTLFGCTYVVIAPESDYMSNLKSQISNLKEVEDYISAAKKKSDLERTELQKDKSGVRLEGIKAINPINNKEVDVYVADYVLASYGTGAVMAVPAHDERDFEFAQKYGLPITNVVQPTDGNPNDNNFAFTNYGVLANSGEFDGLGSEIAKEKITKKLKELEAGDFTVNYKLRDWIFSRQHYWGEPIPFVYCAECAKTNGKKQETRNNNQIQGNISIIDGIEHMIVPVPEDHLPVILPDVEHYEPTDTGESPLAAITDWVNVKCPKCGGEAKRETDTMPNWAGSSWYFLRYCDPKSDKQLAMSDKLNYWMPTDLYNGGMEHTTLHLLYSRFWHKFLFDLGVVPGPEPYRKRIAHGIILGPDGRKMSKSFGNVINPDDIVKEFGADTLRAYIMFIGPYDQESAWSKSGLQGVFRFVNRVWKNQHLIKDSHQDRRELLIKLNQTIKGVSSDIEAFHLNTVVSKLMEFNNLMEEIGEISKESFSLFLKILFPVMPHISSEIWERLGHKGELDFEEWPKYDPLYLTGDMIEVVVQVNGKIKDRFSVNEDISDEELESTALLSEKVKTAIAGKEIVKVIVVPKKLVSIVAKTPENTNQEQLDLNNQAV